MNTKITFGFWLYLMTDLILFGTLFATYAVLRTNTFGGPGGHELFSMHLVLLETIVLLTSSFTIGLGVLAAKHNNKNQLRIWLSVTAVLGITFLSLELSEFYHLVYSGNSWQRSAFLSSYFTLVGTHGLHILFGIIWLIVTIVSSSMTGKNQLISEHKKSTILLLGLFWHFLDIVWIFIFTVIYLIGSH